MNEMQWEIGPRNWGRYRFLLTVLAIVVPFSALAQDACVPTIRSAGPFQIDVSPPGHFIDVCAAPPLFFRLNSIILARCKWRKTIQ